MFKGEISALIYKIKSSDWHKEAINQQKDKSLDEYGEDSFVYWKYFSLAGMEHHFHIDGKLQERDVGSLS